MAIYPSVVNDLLSTCGKYRTNRMSLNDFKASILHSAQAILAVEEHWLKDLLENAEGELELIQFTTNKDEILEKTFSVVERIEKALLKNLKDG